MDTIDAGRHPVNIGHLVMGIAFLGLVGVWTLIQADVVTGDDIRWLLPIPWVFAGIAGLLATTMTVRRRHGVSQSGWVGGEDPAAEPGAPNDPDDELAARIEAAAESTDEER